VNSLTAPSAAVRSEVAAWVTSTGAACVDMPHSLKCEATVAQVEALLSTRLSAFKQHTKGGKIVHRIHPKDTYTIPNKLVGKLLFLTSLVDFPTVRRRNGVFQAITADHSTGRVEATDYSVVPETLDLFYKISGNPGGLASTQAPAEFQNDTSYNKADLKKFATDSALTIGPANVTVGPYDGANPDAEASLDYQYMNAVSASGSATSNNQPWYWTEADWMYEYTQALAALPDDKIPAVFSISWGWSEEDQCTVDPAGPCKTKGNSKGYVSACNQAFATIGARGVSFIVSSGDSGAHGRTDPSCSTPKTHPDWPTASEYVTAVGATQIKDGTSSGGKSPFCTKPPAGLPTCATGGTEIVCSTATGALIVSGGGFSNVSPQPTWQAAAVKAYLASGATLPPTGDFNATSRGYPDVSALGHNYIIYLSGQPTQVDGTSCSAPVWGGVIGLANAARLAAGKKVLGYLNPAIYQIAAANPAVFTDVTVGDNKCTENGCTASCTGFEAAKVRRRGGEGGGGGGLKSGAPHPPHTHAHTHARTHTLTTPSPSPFSLSPKSGLGRRVRLGHARRDRLHQGRRRPLNNTRVPLCACGWLTDCPLLLLAERASGAGRGTHRHEGARPRRQQHAEVAGWGGGG
jgi:hypothetical protein